MIRFRKQNDRKTKCTLYHEKSLDGMPDYPPKKKLPQSAPKSPQNVFENKAMEFLFVVRDACPLLADEQVRWLCEKCILQYD